MIADIDWGFRVSHQELGVAIEKTHNAVDGSAKVDHGAHASHGTAVLGLAGARADGSGICGFAPEAALWAIKADGGAAMSELWAEAIDFVREADAGDRRKVIVLEVQTGIGGNYEQVPSVHRAIKAAIADGCIVCVAAGNGNRRADAGDDGQPFDPTGSILVGATAFGQNSENRRAEFSNYGPRVVICAPGDPLHDLTCGHDSDSRYTNLFGGTSGATPKVAGIAALMLSVNPALSHDEVRDILVGTGSSVSEDPGRPIGVFANAQAAVDEAARRSETAVAAAPPSRTATTKFEGARRRISERRTTTDVERAFAPPRTTASLISDRSLREFRETVTGRLSQSDRIEIVEQAILMLENFYVHRMLKESIHAVRPVQRLRVWLRRLQQTSCIPAADRDELAFHSSLMQIFNSVRDLHTGYLLPKPFNEYIAYLPFEVAPFYDENGRSRYLVTRVLSGHVFSDSAFRPGAELLYWNGMSLDRAVQFNGEQTAGSNEAARRARGINALTIRTMNTTLPPLADHVDIEFLEPGQLPGASSPRRSLRQEWRVRFSPQEGTSRGGSAESMTALEASRVGTMATLGLDAAADSVREARQLIFDADVLQQLESAHEGEERAGIAGSTSPASLEANTEADEVAVRVPWNLIFRARHLSIGARRLGHIHIRTFSVNDVDGFVREFVRLLGRMPEPGLILDVRGNGGGSIWAAEQLLQTLTPVEIEPERMQFIATQGTRDLSRQNVGNPHIPLDDWRASLEEAVETGAVYSRAFAVTPAERCNTIGQQYYGPVVLLVDGNCYSATDMFAAGFQDHNIGPILGIAPTTGAGGANVWDHGLLSYLLPRNWGLVPLPAGAGMRVAIRQSLRIGTRAGALLEDFGVVPDKLHLPSRIDVLEGDRELLSAAASMLAERPLSSLSVDSRDMSLEEPGKREILVKTLGLSRIDLYVDSRPFGSRVVTPDASGRAEHRELIRSGSMLRLAGFAGPDDSQPTAVFRGIV